MTFSIQICRLLHLIGLSLTMGGFFTAFLISCRSKGQGKTDLGAHIASHLVAAPGLVLLTLTGFFQSFLYQWAHFKGAGYMHAKLTLVLLLFLCLAIDIRAQKQAKKGLPTLTKSLAAQALGIASVLAIMSLMIFKPF